MDMWSVFDNAYEKFVLMTMVATHLIYPLIFPTTWCQLKKLINWKPYANQQKRTLLP